MEKEKIIIGLFGHGLNSTNLGIAALSYTNITILNQIINDKNCDAEFCLFFSNSEQNYNWLKNEENILVYSYPELYYKMGKAKFIKYISGIRKCDIFFDICGGDSFSDIYGKKRFIKQFISKLIILLYKKPLILAPQTIGPFNNEFIKVMAKIILLKSKIVFSRDSLSVSYVKGFASKTFIKEATDLAFALPYKKMSREKNKYNIGINISALLYYGGYTKSNQFGLKMNYEKFIDLLLGNLSKNNKYQIHIVAHVLSKNDIENDYLVGKLYSEKFGNVVLAPLFESPIEAKSYISSLDLFIGSRMHSTIAAFSSSIPTIPIAYSRKFKGIFEKYDYKYIIDATKYNEIESLNMVLNYINIANVIKCEVEHAQEHIRRDLEQYKIEIENIFRKSGLVG